MKLTYDSRYNIAYVQLREKIGEVQTLHISDELNIDIGADGKIYGFELLNANDQLREQEGLSLILANEASNRVQNIPLV